MESARAAQPLAGIELPLSIAQHEVWLDQRAWPGGCHLNIGGCGFLEGRLDVARYREALRLLVAETEALRLVPRRTGGQLLLDYFEPTLELVQLPADAPPRAAMREIWQETMREPFALDGAPPWRFILVRADDTLHGITIQFHHAVMDGWGTTRIARRWSEIYNALTAGNAPAIVASGDYRAFIAAGQTYRRSPAFEADAAFWREQWPDIPPPLIPRKRQRGSAAGLGLAWVTHQPIERAAFSQSHAVAAALGVTPFVVMLAAVVWHYAALRKLTEVVVGVPTMNRSSPRERATPGMFVGVFALRIAVDEAATVRQFLASVSAALRLALPHSRYPLSELSRELQVLQSRRDALFDVLLSFERQDYSVAFGEAALVDSRQLFSGVARYPLGVTVCEFGPQQDLELVLEASADCFEPREVEYLARRILHVAGALVAAPDTPLREIDILPPAEREALLFGLHSEVARIDEPVPFVCAFEQQAAMRPDAIALVWAGGQMRYGELDTRARGLAARLLAAGAGPGSIVALALERSPDWVAAVLAIAKICAAFLPLDTDAPLARLGEIISDSEAPVLLVNASNAGRFSGLHQRVLVVDVDDYAQPAEPITLPAPQADDLAYVLYTSGSTGKPKAVMVDQGALSRRLHWLSRHFEVTPADRSAQATQLTFDPAMIEWCLPLIQGASVALPPPGRLSAQMLVRFAREQDVTIMAFVPSTLSRFVDALEGEPSLRLRVACCGGEVLSPELAARFTRATGARLFNVYGPTEATIFATAHECTSAAKGEALPIGTPLDDTRIHVLDSDLQPRPFGEEGDIYIGGRALARGYLRRPEATAAAFIANPWVPGERLYRTGDLGWLDGDGRLYFAGRRDRQIKLRGYRIELPEIEAVLLSAPGVIRAAVQLVPEQGGGFLHAWASGEPGLDAAKLADHLRARLPDYMLPAGITVLPHMPETASGKIDYHACAPPAEAPPAVASREPANAIERELLEVWQRVLKKPVGVADNFFQLGGDSLAAIDMLVGVESFTGRRLPLYVLSEHPTVESFARALGDAGADPQVMRHLPAQAAGEGEPDGARLPLYLAASGHGDALRFAALAAELGPAFEVFMLQPPAGPVVLGMSQLAELYAAQIMARHAPPGAIAGFSVGGLAALETARILALQGQPVTLLVLLDTVYPSVFLRLARAWRALGWAVRLLHLGAWSVSGRRLDALFADPGLYAQVQALSGYTPQPYAGDVVLVKSRDLLSWQRVLFGSWRAVLGNRLRSIETPGMHGSMFQPPQVGALARVLRNMVLRP